MNLILVYLLCKLLYRGMNSNAFLGIEQLYRLLEPKPEEEEMNWGFVSLSIIDAYTV
jgi:hypothetical protein